MVPDTVNTAGWVRPRLVGVDGARIVFETRDHVVRTHGRGR
jgi:hypothetical protein